MTRSIEDAQLIADLQARLAEAQQARERTETERDALLGKEEAVHMGAQAAISAVRQAERLKTERDILRGLLQFAHGALLAFIENGSSSPIDPQTTAAKVIVTRITAALKEVDAVEIRAEKANQ